MTKAYGSFIWGGPYGLSVGKIGKEFFKMKRKLIRPVAAVLAVSVMMPVFAGCNSKNSKARKNAQTITSDSPWYEAKIVEPDLGFDKNRKRYYLSSSMIGTDENNIYVYSNGSYDQYSEDFDWQNFEQKDYGISVVAVIDKESFETVRTIDLNKADIKAGDIYSAYFSDGKIVGNGSGWDEETMSVLNIEVVIDPVTGKIEERECTDNSQVSDIFNIGDYEIRLKANWEGMNQFFLAQIISPDGSEKSVELKEHGKDVFEISASFSLGNDVVLLPAVTTGGTVFYELDLKTGELTRGKNEDYSWMDLYSLYYSFNAPDGNVYYTSNLGIFKIDAKEKKNERIFNYNWCDVNRRRLSYLNIAEVSDDSFILCGWDVKDGPFGTEMDFENSDFIIVSVKRADSNPHAGKTVLELYSSLGFVEDEINDQIKKFNDNNNKYFIEVTDRYTDGNTSIYSSSNSDDEVSERELDYFSKMSNKLTMDIINGEGPDLFLDVTYLDSLKSEEYLADLTPYVRKLDSKKYFTNIIDLAKVDGKLYNLPVSFGISGIQTDSSYAGGSGVGFTAGEYEKFLKEVLNGEDLITSGQPFYFAMLFDYMKEKFIKKGKADFSVPELKILADYVKDNVPERSISWDEIEEDPENGDTERVINGSVIDISHTGPAIYTNCYGYYGYVYIVEQLNGASSILGFPSTDGRGPMASQKVSIAVSAHAYDVDACAEFACSLLSDEVQTELAMTGDLVLNREIFRNVGMQAVEYFNGISIIVPLVIDGSPLPKNKITFTEEHIDALEKCILSCSVMSSQDADVEKIIIEEMPAYFSGQKDLDSVTGIMQDRVQKILDERG